MNDVGGYYYDGTIIFSNPSATNERIEALVNQLAPIYVDKLQSRSTNAAMGLVFMNRCAEQIALTQTIIDNNFKFELRKASN